MQDDAALGIIVEHDVEMPMRDGTILRGNVFRPDACGKYPGLLLRTPYGKPAGGFERYVRAGYVVVSQDVRGRYASDGDFVPFTVEHTGDAEDGYDSVEWLAALPCCDGNVGSMGCSYNAWMQWQLAKLRPPSLKAMCAYSIPVELTEVDWPGAFKPGRRIKWWLTTIAPDLRRRHGWPEPHTGEQARSIWDDLEHGRWLGLVPWMDVVKYLPPGLAEYADDWMKHPNRRAWRFDEAHCEIDVPNLDFTGWFDHCNGSMGHLPGMQKNGRTSVAREQTKLIIGPWSHVTLGQRQTGGIDFGAQAALDIHDLIIRWFDHWLKDTGNGIERHPAVRYFVMGSGKWRCAPTWPPQDKRQFTLYLSSEGTASPVENSGALLSEPPEAAPPDAYDYDPVDPVPTLWDRNLFAGASDRRKLEYRRDILYYRTPPLEQEVEIVGHPRAVLFASSSAPDTDFFVRLVDEDPDGAATEVSMGMVRARHRHSLDDEELLEPGQVTEFPVKLGATACRFAAGHRIRLEITSSDFPNFDRNHNVGRDDLADAEFAVAHNQVYHSAEYPSRLVMDVEDD